MRAMIAKKYIMCVSGDRSLIFGDSGGRGRNLIDRMKEEGDSVGWMYI